jgi:hypothetical protein
MGGLDVGEIWVCGANFLSAIPIVQASIRLMAFVSAEELGDCPAGNVAN